MARTLAIGDAVVDYPSEKLRQAVFNAIDREQVTTQDVLDAIKPFIAITEQSQAMTAVTDRLIAAADKLNKLNVQKAQMSAQLNADPLYRDYMDGHERDLDEAFQEYYSALTIQDRGPIVCCGCEGAGGIHMDPVQGWVVCKICNGTGKTKNEP